MEIHLLKASLNNAEEIWQMQKKSFAELLEKYQDFETSPANEPLEKTIFRLKQPDTYFYFIQLGKINVGAVRVVDSKNESWKRISPIFVLPEFRNMGIAQKVIMLAEEIHGNKNWELDTILQEKGNCHLYEKMGYKATGATKVINDKLTLILYKK